MLRIRKVRNPFGGKKTLELTIPPSFRCPISLDLMKDPVTLCTGITYDRQSIDTWLDAGNRTCPATKQVLHSLEQIPNHTLRRMIQDWCVVNRSYGIERIPTPRIPVTRMDVSKIFEEITIKSRKGDRSGCLELVKKVEMLGRETERNRRLIVSNETARALSEAFNTFAAASADVNASVLESVLSLIIWMFPLDDEETWCNLGSPSSLNCLAWFLKCGSLAGRRNAVLVMRELASSHQSYVDALSKTDGLVDALVNVIREPICPMTTKASLLVIYYMVSSSASNETIVMKLVEMGVVSLLLEMLVDSDKSVCEKALGALDGIFSYEKGREAAYIHALTTPVLVKKMFRVTDLATEFAVSGLWKLCKNYKGDDGGFLVDALMVGVFQKVLLLLQVGCGERTKEKATDLLKMLNVHRGNGECIDSMDFKQLKRPF
ncbi:hypothetical protein AAC387_Pa09g2362 [Persea americana]